MDFADICGKNEHGRAAGAAARGDDRGALPVEWRRRQRRVQTRGLAAREARAERWRERARPGPSGGAAASRGAVANAGRLKSK